MAKKKKETVDYKSQLEAIQSGNYTYKPQAVEKTTVAQPEQSDSFFADGYDFGDVTKTVGKYITNAYNKNNLLSDGYGWEGFKNLEITRTILGTGTDIYKNLTKGAAGTVEGALDYGVNLASGLFDENTAKKMRDFAQYNITDTAANFNVTNPFAFLSRVTDLVDSGDFASLNPFDTKAQERYNERLNKNSIQGETAKSIEQGIGQLGAQAALKSIGVPWQVTAFTSAAGNEMNEAFKNNATYGQAFVSGLVSGIAETASEYFGAGADKFLGMNSLTGKMTKKLGSKISSKLVQQITKLGIDATSEGIEEILSGLGSALGKQLTYMSDKEFNEIYSSDDALNDFLGGFVVSALANVPGAIQSSKRGENAFTGYTDAETKVIKNEVNKQVQERQQNGEKLTSKQIDKITQDVEAKMKKGQISTGSIEEALGLADKVRDVRLDTEAKLGKELTSEEAKQLEQEIREQYLQDNISNSYLQESYLDEARIGESFTYDSNNYSEKQLEYIKELLENNDLNNKNNTHTLVDFLAKLYEEKGVKTDLTNNEKLEEANMLVDGEAPQGMIDKNTGKILLNMDAKDSINSVFGHEVTHVLEGTDAYEHLQNALKEYVGEQKWNDMLQKRKDRYQTTDDVYAAKELTSDLAGKYLFTDADYVMNLSVKDKNLFQKIYDEIKYLVKLATAGSNEERQLLKIKKMYDEAYKKGNIELSKQQAQTSTDTNKQVEAKVQENVELQKKAEKEIKNNTIDTQYSLLSDLFGKNKTEDRYHVRNITEEFQEEILDKTVNNLKNDNVVYINPKMLNQIQDRSGYRIPEEVDKLANSIKKDGITRPILLSIDNGEFYIRDGHHLSQIAEDFGLQYVPVRFSENLTKKLDSLLNNNYNGVYNELLNEVKNIYETNKNTNGFSENMPISENKYRNNNEDIVPLENRETTKENDSVYAKIQEINNRTRSNTRDSLYTNKSINEDNTRFSLSQNEELNNYIENNGFNFDNSGNLKVNNLTDKQIKKLTKAYNKNGYTDVNETFVRNRIEEGFKIPRAVADTFIENDLGHKPQIDTTQIFEDAEGNPLTKEQVEFYKDSDVRDIRGRLIPVYHTTDAKFTIFNPKAQTKNGKKYGKGLYFSTTPENFGNNEMKLYLNAKDGEYKFVQDKGYYIVQEPNMVKNVDNKAPTDNPDIRYSLTDNKGRELSENQQEYFKDSKVRDNNGNLEVMYHTTPSKFTVFDNSKLGENTEYDNTAFGFFVTPNSEFSSRFGDINNEGNESNTMELYANVTNPITHPYNADYKYSGDELDNIVERYFEAIGEEEGLNELKSYVDDGDYENLYDAYMNVVVTELSSPFENADYEKELLEENGYDAVEFVEGNESNVIDGGQGNEPVISYAVFNSNQLKNIDNKNPTDNQDIRYSLSSSLQDSNINTTTDINNDFFKEHETDYENRLTDDYIAFEPNQIKNVDNTNPTSSPDIRYSLTQKVDTELDDLTNEQYEYFKNTKAVDKNGELEVVYHGTPHEFSVFDIEKAGETGLMFGNGFYFTTSQGRAEAFIGDNDNGLKSGYVNIEKPASRDTKTMTYNEFYNLYNALNENPNMYNDEMGMSNIDALLSDYGNIYNDKENTIKKFYDSYNDDVSLIDNLSYIGNPTEMYKTLRDATGYDGIVVEKPSDFSSERWFVAFNPDQFKLKSNKTPTNNVDMNLSLYTNNDIAPLGDFNVQGKDILKQQNKTSPEGIDYSIKGDIMDLIHQEIQRKNGKKVQLTKPVVAKEKSALRTGIDTLKTMFTNNNTEIDNLAKESGNLNIKYAGDMLNNVSAEATNDIVNAQTDNYGNAIGKSVQQLFEKAKAEGKEAPFNDYLINYSNIDRWKRGKGSQTPLDVSERLVADYEAKYPQFKEWAKDVWKYSENIRKNWLEAGMITQNMYNILSEAYPHYVPYISDTGNFDATMDKLNELKARPIKRAVGGATELFPVEEALTRYTFAQKKALRQNNLYRQIYNTLQTNPGQRGAEVGENYFTGEEPNLYRDDSGNYLTAVIDGEERKVQISDDLFKSLRNDMETQIKDLENRLSLITKPLQTVGNIRRKILTNWSPSFAITNPLKDIQDAFLNSKHTKEMAKNYLPGIKELWTASTPEAKQFMALYGEGNLMGQYENESGLYDAQKGAKNGKFLKRLSKVNNIMELAPRYAEFKASLQAGESVEQAMYNAREVTTNFGRGGVITKALNRNGFTFLNANVQGFDKFIRNFSGENGAKGIVNSLLKATMFGIVPAVFNELAFGGAGDDKDEDYDALPDYIKDNYYLIKIGDGSFVRIPKGRMLSVFGSAARRTIEALEGEEDAFEGYLSNVNNQIGINNPEENNIFSPFIQAYGTKNGTAWYGGDIVPTRLQDKPKNEQYDASTDKMSIWLGDKLKNIPILNNFASPYKLNYVLDQYSGGIGDLVLPMITDEATSNGSLLAPVVDKFTADSTTDNKYVSDFYNKNDELKVQANSSEATDDDYLRNEYMKSISKEMSKLYAERREIQSDNSLSKSEKYEKSQAIKDQINKLAKYGLDSYDNISVTGNYAEVGDDMGYYKNAKGNWTPIDQKDIIATESIGLTDREKSTYYGIKNDMYNIDQKYEPKLKTASDEEKTVLNAQKKVDIINSIKNTNLPDEAKAKLYDKKYASTETLDAVINCGIDFDSYLDLQAQNFTADKNIYGNTINGSKKSKVYSYINNMNIPYEQKIMLAKLEYKSDNTYNREIISYLNNDDSINYYDMVEILKAMGFKVDEYGNITW